MMLKVALLIIMGTAVSEAARIRRDDQPPISTQALLESGLNIAQEGVKKLEEIAGNLINANSTDELLNHGNTILDQVKSLAKTITKTTKEWSDNTSVQELKDIATNALQGFKDEHPDLTTAVSDSIESLNKVANEIILKLKLLVDDKDVKQVSDTLIDTASSGITIVKDQLKETTQALAEQLKKDAAVKDKVTERK